MSFWKKFKEWFNSKEEWKPEWKLEQELNLKHSKARQANISKGLDAFKYRTLSKHPGYEQMAIWKEGSDCIMNLKTEEAQELLNYLNGSKTKPRLEYDNKNTQSLLRIPSDKNTERLGVARSFARKYEYKEIAYQENVKMVSFEKDGVRINYYFSTGTVMTALKHPKLGPTQLTRRGVSYIELEKIFKNPRSHTGKGYHQKKKLDKL